MFASLEYTGVVIDLGAGLTQISPVDNGYTSYLSSSNFKVTGEAVDEYLLFSLGIGNEIDIPINTVSKYVVRKELKEVVYKS